MRLGLAAIACCVPAQAFAATPQLIVFGGGHGVESNQLSLETQVGALSQALAAAHPVILFGGDDQQTRNVQVSSPNVDPTDELLGIVFDHAAGLGVEYSAISIKRQGTADRAALLAALDKTAPSTDGTIVFGVGHGSKPDDDTPAALMLWGPIEDALRVDELAKHLDHERRHAPIAFVLGQCHSGAFADLVYEAGKRSNPIARPARCALAAIPADREAAGCTPDVDDPSARSYMALIAEAFQKPKDADFDGDGKVSLAEAHGYAHLHDDTIDVPVTSSEAWLRTTLGDHAPKSDAIRIAELMALARPAQRAVLVGLRPASSTTPGARLDVVEKQLDALNKRADTIDAQIAALESKASRARHMLQQRLFAKWPELDNPYRKESRELLAGDAALVVAFIRGRPELGELDALERQIGTENASLYAIEKQSARLERWLRTAEIVAFEAEVRKKRPRPELDALDRILACEAMQPL